MSYYSYLLLVLSNCFSFKHYNTVNDNNEPLDKSIKLWSISRWRYLSGTTTYTAEYNAYTKNYIFNGKRYLSHDELICDALKIK